MQKLYQRIGNVEIVISAIFLSLCCLLIFFSALARSVGKPINWSQDFSLFLFAWSVFLSGDVAFRRDKLVRVELLVNYFSPRTARIVCALCYLIILAFLIALVYYGIKLSIISSKRVFQGIPGFSYTWVTVSVPLGSVLMLSTLVLKFIRLFRENKTDPAGEEKQ